MRRWWISVSLVLSSLLLVIAVGSALADHDDDDNDHDKQPAANALAFQAVMTGRAEVPANGSTGVGLGSFLLSRDGSTLYYTLEVTGASSTVNAAHIHQGRRGQNGDIVVNLCGAGSAPGCATEGVIVTGSITAGSLVGPLAGHPLSDLLNALRSGNAYANVHTANMPNGELRGQVTPIGAVARAVRQADKDDHDNGNHRGHDHDDDGS
jgi:hypothetical protein